MWGGYSDGDIANEVFRSDAIQVRIEKRAFGDANSTAGVMTFVFSWTFSKEILHDLLLGQSLAGQHGREPGVEPQRQYRHARDLSMPNYNPNMVYAMPTPTTRPRKMAFSGVWDLPIGKGRKFGNGGDRRGRQDRQRLAHAD